MDAYSYLIENIGFNIHEIGQKKSSCANIFFHGYTSITSEDDIEILKQSIPIIDNKDSILVHWDSGNIKQAAAQSIFEVIHNDTPEKKSSVKERIFSWGKEVLTNTANDLVENFISNEKKADILASKLSYILDKCEFSHPYDHINLIGHSLGARLVLQGVCTLSENFKSKIKSVVLMGGAIGWRHEFGPSLKHFTNLHLFNLYSSKDLVLVGKPGFERSIGRCNIPESTQYRVTNIHCDGFGHTDYWPQFIHLNETYKFLDITSNA